MINKIESWLYQFLRRGQKYTGTDNVYLATGGFWLILGQLIPLGISFLTTVAFANLLNPVTYGNYKYLLSLLGMLAILSLIGVETAVAQATARGLEGSFYTGFKTKLKWGVLGSLATLGMAAYYWLKGNTAFPIPLLISAIFFPLMQASRVYSSFLEGKKIFNIRTKFSIISDIAPNIAVVGTLFLTKNIFWLIAVYLILNTFLNYSFYLITKIKFKPNKEEDPKTLNYGKHLSLMGVISQTAAYLDKILLFAFTGPVQLAVYSFAMILPEQIQNILGNIDKLALPKLAIKSREEIKATLMKKFWKLSFLVGIIIILYILIVPYFFEIFFPRYLDSVPYSQLYMLSAISVPAALLGTVFQAKMMKKELYLIKIAPLVNIGLMAALIPFYGIWGAIMALIVAQTFKAGLILFLFRKF